MFNNDDKKVLEAIYDMIMEQNEVLNELKLKIDAATTSVSVTKKGIQGLADILGCSKTTASKRLKMGQIPHSRHGDIYQFDEKEVLEAMKNKKRLR